MVCHHLVKIVKSTKADKKMMAVFEDCNTGREKTVHFGSKGMSDYTKHKDKERMRRYTTRHKARENWRKSGIKTAGFWSKWLLWNKPSIGGSKKDISSKFNVTFKSGWPKKRSKAT